MSVLNDVGSVTVTKHEHVWETSWEVNNFEEYNIFEQQISSPIFSISISNKVVNWRLRFCLGTENHRVIVFLENISDVDVLANFHVIIAVDGNLTYELVSKWKELLLKNQYYSVPGLTRGRSVAEYMNFRFTNGTLKISWKVFKAALVDTQQNHLSNYAWNTIKDCNRIHELDDYEKLLDDKESSDVTFVVGGKEISLHKAILGLKSPVFRAMFQHEMKEKKENLVKIDDIQYDVMIEVFRFMYAGKVNGIDDKVRDLYLTADKYSITGLKTLCEQHLYNTLKVENAVEYLNLTVMCNAVNLKAHIIEFVVNGLDETSKNPQFKLLPSEVMYEIIRAIAEKKSNN